jgi:hypothetical protein
MFFQVVRQLGGRAVIGLALPPDGFSLHAEDSPISSRHFVLVAGGRA